MPKAWPETRMAGGKDLFASTERGLKEGGGGVFLPFMERLSREGIP